MRNKEKFDEILNECLEALEKGQSLEACLDRYPEHAQSLRPLLETALAARRVAKLRPRPEFKEAVRRRLREAAGHQVAVEQARRFHLRFGFAGAVALVLV
ncbi:MAG: hypothetical protein N3E40_03065, partial [Dehalococcoidia bacterium]|nr:hypothetical protein [Dehalococcoidia bacterium]